MSDVESLMARSPKASTANSRPSEPRANSTSREVQRPAPLLGSQDRSPSDSSETRWVLELHEPEEDRKALEHLADRCQWFSPRVGLEPGLEPDGLRLEIGRAARWFGNEQLLVEQLLGWLVRAGYWPRIAVADTLGMAWGWARFAKVACGQWRVRNDVSADSDRESSDRESSEKFDSQEQGANSAKNQKGLHSMTEACSAKARGSSRSARTSDWQIIENQTPTLEQRAAAQERASLRQWKRKDSATGTRQRTTWSGTAVMSPAEMRAWADETQHRHWLEEIEQEVLGKAPPCSVGTNLLQQENSNQLTNSKQSGSPETCAGPSSITDAVEIRSYPLPCFAPVGDQSEFGLLPVEALKLEGATCEILRQLGIERVHQLGSLPREGLATRLGLSVLLRWDQVWGVTQETWQTFHATPELRCELDLEIPSADRSIVESWLEEALRRVVERLWERRRGALRLRVTLRGATGVVGAWGLDLFRPTIELKHLRDLLKYQAEKRPPRGAVTGIEIEVLLDGRLETHQQELFDDGSLDRRAAGGLVETLSGRLGRERVVEVVLRGDPQPEKAFATRPVTGSGRSRLNRIKARYLQVNPGENSSTGSRGLRRRDARAVPLKKPPVHALPLPIANSPPHAVTATAESAALEDASREEAAMLEAREWSHVLRRPLRCWSRPVALEVIALANHGPPAAFRFLGKAWRVAEFWGPERIETSWWRGPWVRRDYYRIETEEGYRFWIFRCLESKAWFLHGAF